MDVADRGAFKARSRRARAEALGERERFGIAAFLLSTELAL